jgi:O-antigen/teichoic acid export membrane protein
LSRTKINYAFNLILTGFNILFPIISFPYAAKVLGPEGIGKVQFILSFTQYFGLIAALGIPIYGVRVISQSAHDCKLLYRNLSELLSIHIICSVIVSVVYLIIIFSFSFFKQSISLYFLSGSIILMGFTSIDWYFSGIENFKLIAVRSVSVKIISLIGLFIFVKVKADYNIYLILSIIAITGNNLINIFSVRKNIVLGFKGIRKHIKPLSYTFGTTVATSMYTMLDTVLIGFFADEKAVGLYSASIKLTKVSLPLIISSATVLMPKISKLFSSNDYESLQIVLNRSFSFIVVGAIPICLGLLILAPQLTYAFSGTQFNDAIVTMRILSPLTLIIGLGYFWGFQILIPAGKEREMLLSVILGMILNLSLNFILIPLYRQNGAAVANIISEFVVTLAYIYFSFKVIKFKISHKSILTNLLASLPLILIVLFFRIVVHNIYAQLFLIILTFTITYIIVQVKLLKNSIINDMLMEYIKTKRT